MIDLIDAPPPVLRVLCKYHYLHSVLVAKELLPDQITRVWQLLPGAHRAWRSCPSHLMSSCFCRESFIYLVMFQNRLWIMLVTEFVTFILHQRMWVASDGCYDDVRFLLHFLNVRFQLPSVNMATELRVSGKDTWSKYTMEGLWPQILSCCMCACAQESCVFGEHVGWQ